MRGWAASPWGEWQHNSNKEASTTANGSWDITQTSLRDGNFMAIKLPSSLNRPASLSPLHSFIRVTAAIHL
jgi:hypothetical protein